ncbi:MAG: ABC transporter substrate-binding protein [Gemmatimonadota bacterium]
MGGPDRWVQGVSGARAGRGGRTALTVGAGLSAMGAGLFAWGCGRGPVERVGERALVLGYSAELQTLNPLVSTDQNANELIYYLLYTPLVTYDSTYRVRPWLAESWELTDSAVVFRLREDLRWHDGAPVTAEDVKFTFDMAKDPATASPLAAAYLSNVASAEVLDTYRIRFAFAAPHAQPLEDFFWPPVPRHLLEDVSPAEMSRHPFNRHPVGSGPYRFESWEVGERLVFEGTGSFPAPLGGPARLRRVVYRIVPEATTLLAELLRGEIQVDGPLGPADAGRVRESPGVRLLAFPWRQFTYVGWNLRRAPFREAAARRALTMAIDRRGLLDAVLHGYGTPASSVIPPWHPYAPRLEPLPYAPDSAASLLGQLGWQDVDGDGILERDGEPFRFVLLTSGRNPAFADLVQIIQAQLRRIGVEVEPRLLEWQAVLTLHRSRDFDAVLTNWILDNFRVDPRPLFHSSQAHLPGSANRSSYASRVADSLMDLGVRTLDESDAEEIWRRFAEQLQADQPITLLFWNDELAAVSDALEGVRMDARGELSTLSRWRWREGKR